MENIDTGQLEKRLEISRKFEVRYYFVLVAIIVIGIGVGIYSVVYYVRKDNDRTRTYIKCVIDSGSKAATREEARQVVAQCSFN